ncbi:MAG: stimulus-sensing domain-containing protein, partial [Pseudomonadota bacterium]
TRARVISSDFSVIVDSKEILSFDLEGEAGDVTDPGRPRWKDFWTRSLHLLIGKEVQVYRERDLSTARDYPEVVQAMRGDPKTLLFLNQAGEQIVNVAVPIKRQDQVLGVLLMSTLPGEVDTILSEASQGFWKLVLVAFLASVLSALFLARTVAKPIRKLSASAERVSKDINARKELAPDVGGGLEVAQMRTALQTMVASLYRRIENSEKFAADVAHELKNPLAAASSTAQCLTYAKTEEQRQELVDQIGEELRRLNRLITDVSRASRLEAELALQTTDHVDVTRVLQGVIDIFKDKPAAEHCTVALQLADADAGALFVGGNAGRLAQVMTNLIDNAVSFTSPGGTVCVGARRNATHVIIWVDDEGPGLEAGSQDTIFTRFYTHRPTEFSSRGNNSGLGLSISREIVTAHGGDIWAENREAAAGPMESTVASKPASSAALQAVKGARFTVRLPVRAVDLVNSAAE